jgi:hypothetical protein
MGKQTRPRLKKSGDNYINKFGVEITEAEKRKLESLVVNSNRKRDKLLNKFENTERYVMGKPTGETWGKFKDRASKNFKADWEENFLTSKKSKSLHQFKNRESFEYYLHNLEYSLGKDYATKKVADYKENYIKSLKTGLGIHSNHKLIQKINNMSDDDFLLMTMYDESVNITSTYSRDDKSRKITRINTAIDNMEYGG